MSFDEEHLDDHYLCQREVAERDARIRELEAMQGHCQIHGECPVCRANRIAGDLRIGVASTFDRSGDENG